MPFEFKKLALPEVLLIAPKVFGDSRGAFMELYKASDFKPWIPETFVQINFSRSAKGVLRGLHFQKNPKAQGKLVKCMKGKILDVAVDIRKGSPNFGKWVGEILDDENNNMLYVPPGFGHGFCVYSDFAEVMYQVTEEFSAAHDRGFKFSDPTVGVEWNLEKPTISEKDRNSPLLADCDNDFTF
ncbi:MAG: dTDP-4-dehydrorhamnose 3,5-epimerase [Elusimicrobiaceae bacterium]|jgi:dTDP-4-dehydrorhamnose 3,5-epimerase